MGMYSVTYLAWGCPLTTKYNELIHPDFELIPSGCQMSDSPELVDFAAVKSTLTKVSDSYCHIDFATLRINDLLTKPALKDKIALRYWLKDNGLIEAKAGGWYILNWRS